MPRLKKVFLVTPTSTYRVINEAAIIDGGDVSDRRAGRSTDDVIDVEDQLRNDVNTNGDEEVDVNARPVTPQPAESRHGVTFARLKTVRHVARVRKRVVSASHMR